MADTDKKIKTADEERAGHPQSAHFIFLGIVGLAFIALAVVFLCFPRPRYSELEKRELTEFPDVTSYGAKITELPSDISSWFSDSQPFRDDFMGMSMNIRDAIGFHFGNPEDNISFKPSEPGSVAAEASPEYVMEDLEAAGNPLADAIAKQSNSGTIVVGSGKNVRALMGFGGTPKMGEIFLNMVREYVKAVPGVTFYALIPPAATEFYLPDKARKLSKPEKPVLDYIEENLPEGVKYVDAYTYLAAHTDEDIYLRTDHHWAPLGAFYAAKALAITAGVPFKELDSYDRHVIPGFVGSMYGYTQDIAVKNAPEDFVYYTPRGLNHKSTYTKYKTNKDYQVVSAEGPYQDNFFQEYESKQAYLTFMGGDQYLVKINTGTPSKRKLMVIKDSYGNPLPSFLFYSFGEIHVVDWRFFPLNLPDYVKKNGITDIVFAFNIFNAVTSTSMKHVTKFLTQDGSFASSSKESQKKTSKESQSKKSEGKNSTR